MRKIAKTASLLTAVCLVVQLLLAAALPVGVVVAEEPAAPGGVVTVQVNSTEDLALGSGVDCSDASSKCTLRAAIQQATANTVTSNTYKIELPAGNYTVEIGNIGNVNDGEEDDSATGDYDIKGNIEIVGPSQGGAVINFTNGRGPIDRVFEIFHGATVKMSDLTIKGGNGSGKFGHRQFGGGILNEGNLTLERITLTENSAGNGAALTNRNGGKATLINCNLFGNGNIKSGELEFKTLNGGAIYQYDEPDKGPSELELQNTTVSNNKVYGGVGGGLVIGGGTVSISGGEITGNEADLYGGLNVSDGTVTLDNVRVMRNKSLNFGGGIGFNNGSLVIDNNSSISENTAGGDGGGIAATFSGTLTIRNSIIQNNQAAGKGSALYAGGSVWKPQVELKNNQIIGNKKVISENNYSDEGQIVNDWQNHTIKATNNWWGSAYGPGDKFVSGDVQTAPWCTDEACTPSPTELSQLSVSKGELTPAFSPDSMEYLVYAGDTDSIEITATAANPSAAVMTVNQAPAASGQPSVVQLNPGTNVIPITLTATGFPSQTYKLTVVRNSFKFVPSLSLPTKQWDFYEPQRIASDQQSNVYIMQSDGWIQKYDSSGNLLVEWEDNGSMPGEEFPIPAQRWIAAAPDGSLYVSDYTNGQIRKYSAEGVSRGTWDSSVGFTKPKYVASDDAGTIYVADYDNNGDPVAIKMMNQGQFQVVPHIPAGPFAVAGSGENTIIYAANEANGTWQIVQYDWNGDVVENGVVTLVDVSYISKIAIGPDGNVYALDPDKDKLYSISPNQTVMETTIARPAWNRDARLSDIAVASDNHVYVAREMLDSVWRFANSSNMVDIDGNWAPQWEVWAFSGESEGYFSYPEATAVGKDGSIYVLDTGNNRVQRFKADGTFLGAVNKAGNVSFDEPSGIAVGSDGSVYVTDTGNHRIVKLETGLKNPVVWGSAGAGDGQFQMPVGIAVDGETVYVADSGNRRIQKLNAMTGVYEGKWAVDGLDGRQAWPYGIAVDAEHHIYVTDTATSSIHKYSSQNELLKTWAFDGFGVVPMGIAVDTIGIVHVVFPFLSNIMMFDQNGIFIGDWGRDFNLSGPVGIATDAQGNLYVADTRNHRVVQFTSGNATAVITGISATPSNVSLKLGATVSQQLQIMATMSDETTKDVTASGEGTTYTSSVPSVAAVSANGLIEAKAAGSTVITVTNGAQQATVNVTVAAADTPPPYVPPTSPPTTSTPTPTAPPVTPKPPVKPEQPASTEKPVKATEGGSAQLEGVGSATIPAGALPGDGTIKIAVVAGDEAPSVESSKLLSEIAEFTSSTGGLFKKKIKLTLRYDRLKLKDKEAPAVYYYNEKLKRWIFLGGKDNGDGTITVEVNHFTKFAVLAYQPVHFGDLDKHWAKTYADRLVGMNVIRGFGDGTFRPEDTVTRAQFAKMLADALGLEATEQKATLADQESIPAWASDAVHAAMQAGIIKGYSEQGAILFKPEQTITRAEMSVMIARALKYMQQEYGANLATLDGQSAPTFADQATIPSWAVDAVNEAVANGIIQGYGNGSFRSGGDATRAEAAVMLFKMLEVLNI